MKSIQLAIVEDKAVVRENLYLFLTETARFEVPWCEASVEAFLQKLQDSKPHVPDIILLDIQLPGMSGIEGISWILERAPNADIIMLTTFEDEDSIYTALREGASSYLSKRSSLSDIQEAIHVVSRGGSYMSPSIARKVIQHFKSGRIDQDILTPRQRQIVQGITDGLSYQEVADKLFISLDTVRAHIKNIYKLLNIKSKAELIRKSLKGEI